MDGNRFLDNLKDDFRRGALAQRDALSVEARADAAKIIAAAPLPVELPHGVIVAGYSPINSELDPYPLMHALADKGATLALPVIIARDHALIFREWQPEEGLVRGPYGIFQPSSDADEVDPDVVLVPLAAFDRAGHRIGYGRGYYDRTLENLRAIKKVTVIGVAFAVQEIETVPRLPHDEQLDCVLTERELIDLRRL
ncbi:MAG: 5-formyltetrahydrofolate cyclo-ligase [Candidatus Afipia apatlaquensis]|uniref:5-formyltetrahydrofolate cyclo-ligase n=1 Tax=Candidatus Afipia apatlaquensis TaxID=2712852 RepID=A0A7C9RIG2_9BRAD|nr:5-formyltetrahydrofolate cyclo-ligase [Candidatus Afipia apatlaquensis]